MMSAPQRVRSVATRYWATALLALPIAGLMITSEFVDGLHDALVDAFGLNWPSLLDGQLWRLFTGPLVQATPGMVWGNLIGLFFLPKAETKLGTKTMLATFFGADIAVSLTVLITLRLALASGIEGARHYIDTFDGGSSVGIIAVLAAAAFYLRDPLRQILFSVSAVILSALLIFGHHIFDFQHMLAFIGVVLIGIRRSRSRSSTRPLRPAGVPDQRTS